MSKDIVQLYEKEYLVTYARFFETKSFLIGTIEIREKKLFSKTEIIVLQKNKKGRDNNWRVNGEDIDTESLFTSEKVTEALGSIKGVSE